MCSEWVSQVGDTWCKWKNAFNPLMNYAIQLADCRTCKIIIWKSKNQITNLYFFFFWFRVKDILNLLCTFANILINEYHWMVCKTYFHSIKVCFIACVFNWLSLFRELWPTWFISHLENWIVKIFFDEFFVKEIFCSNFWKI